jgi:hypothetical protein
MEDIMRTYTKDPLRSTEIIKLLLIPALTSLGGVASSADIKKEILRMTNTKVEDYGRTPPSKKYPKGRFTFVQNFTLVSVKMKRKGMVFTPAYAHISLDPNATISDMKKPVRVAENYNNSAGTSTNLISKSKNSKLEKDKSSSLLRIRPQIVKRVKENPLKFPMYKRSKGLKIIQTISG